MTTQLQNGYEFREPAPSANPRAFPAHHVVVLLLLVCQLGRQAIAADRHTTIKMANFRRFTPGDLNKLSKCNLDPLTETYELSFYLQYYAKWPALFQVAEDSEGNIIGYSAPLPVLILILILSLAASLLPV